MSDKHEMTHDAMPREKGFVSEGPECRWKPKSDRKDPTVFSESNLSEVGEQSSSQTADEKGLINLLKHRA